MNPVSMMYFYTLEEKNPQKNLKLMIQLSPFKFLEGLG